MAPVWGRAWAPVSRRGAKKTLGRAQQRHNGGVHLLLEHSLKLRDVVYRLVLARGFFYVVIPPRHYFASRGFLRDTAVNAIFTVARPVYRIARSRGEPGRAPRAQIYPTGFLAPVLTAGGVS